MGSLYIADSLIQLAWFRVFQVPTMGMLRTKSDSNRWSTVLEKKFYHEEGDTRAKLKFLTDLYNCSEIQY